MLIAKRQQEPVIGGGGLQLEIERAAKALPKGQSPGARDARSEGRMQNQLHASGLVKEPFCHNRFLGWQRTQFSRTGADVSGRLSGSGFIKPAILKRNAGAGSASATMRSRTRLTSAESS